MPTIISFLGPIMEQVMDGVSKPNEIVYYTLGFDADGNSIVTSCMCNGILLHGPSSFCMLELELLAMRPNAIHVEGLIA